MIYRLYYQNEFRFNLVPMNNSAQKNYAVPQLCYLHGRNFSQSAKPQQKVLVNAAFKAEILAAHGQRRQSRRNCHGVRNKKEKNKSKNLLIITRNT
jgi:hypothetical protein